jgi:hypothetical protein
MSRRHVGDLLMSFQLVSEEETWSCDSLASTAARRVRHVRATAMATLSFSLVARRGTKACHSSSDAIV